MPPVRLQPSRMKRGGDATKLGKEFGTHITEEGDPASITVILEAKLSIVAANPVRVTLIEWLAFLNEVTIFHSCRKIPLAASRDRSTSLGGESRSAIPDAVVVTPERNLRRYSLELNLRSDRNDRRGVKVSVQWNLPSNHRFGLLQNRLCASCGKCPKKEEEEEIPGPD
ncbi:unnamed protein product [Taenia asiatica]|uniref:Uncharacterized protein n=1 Tax=Taenia asiatica TaxID=60517 RepID=A0A0R3WBJ3_TAEAS|nr:unnamed protein product [Taenia asiatica]